MKPPQPATVAYRALCLGALQWRADYELVIRTMPNPGVTRVQEEMAVELRDWLVREGIAPYQSAREEALFDKPLGEWSEQELTAAGWRRESGGVIVWALSHRDRLPPYDTSFADPEAVAGLPILRPVGDFVERARLRPIQEIARERDVAEMWHWRAQTRQRRRQGAEPPEGWTFEQMIQVAANTAYENRRIPEPIENDFPALGKAYCQLSEEEYANVAAIANERHWSLNWLCGYAEEWDSTPTETKTWS